MKKIIFGLTMLALLASCKDDDPIINPNPGASEGSTIEVNGLAGGEAGTSAGNSVFIDFSGDKQTAVLRAGWDLGFYCGDDYRVMLNYTTAATAFVTDKTDINAVGASDTDGVVMSLSFGMPSESDFELLDDIDGDLSKTLIPAISSTDASNKVVIINRGTGAGTPARDFYKVRILRKGSSGYTLQYAKLDATTYKTIDIDKDNNYNFKYVSFDDGLILTKPAKNDWDIEWTAAIYKTSMGGGVFVPYVFSDLVMINYLNGTKAAEKTYPTAEEATAAFDSYARADLDAETFSSERWFIGSNWRRTAAPGATEPAGTIKTKFYIIKDNEGNAYKVKFLSFTTEDGGTRGKPEIKYVLIK